MEWRKMEPSIQRGGALLTAGTGSNPNAIRDALDGIAQADFLFNQESRKSDPVPTSLRSHVIILIFVICLHGAVLSL
jgi:hypothetical protein